MSLKIKTITLSLPFRLGNVNCYLVKTDNGFILFDTGGSNKREDLERELQVAGCQPGDLKLIVLTHGDFDHSGNAAYLRRKYAVPVAMHNNDVGMVEHGDMSWNRQSNRFILRVTSLLFGFGQSQRFTPDFYLDEGGDLSEYGLQAQILLIPGHSKGSIGVLLPNGDLIGGDLFENTKAPALNSIMDDQEAARASAEKLKGYKINTVYPGHGQPFLMETYWKTQ